jgi:uncharacterized protein YcfL
MKHLLLLSYLALAGCASHPESTISVQPVRATLGQINSNLSAIDGKTTVVETWLKNTH